MNLVEKFNQGQAGGNKGFPMGEGLEAVSAAINGVQKGRTYGVAAGAKVGKSTLVDAGFVIEPCLEALKTNLPIEIHYNSFEISRVNKEFDFMCHFLYTDYGIEEIFLPEGVTSKGLKTIPLTSDFLMGQVKNDLGEIILVDRELQSKMIAIYETRIIPFFGEFAANGKQIKPGLIVFNELKENPTGLRNKILKYAEANGKFIYETEVGSGGKQFHKKIGYKANNPDKLILIVTDHLRKIPVERGFTRKETIDKYLEYCTEIRDLCNYSFVHIIHLNRSMSDINRLKYLEDRIYPTSEDVKDTGNLSEEVNYLFTMFDPNDDKYNLKKHFGLIIKNTQNDILYPNLRTLHLVENRHGPAPQHFRVEMKGAVKFFNQFKN